MAGKKKESAVAPQRWEDVPEIPKEEQPYPLPEGWKWVYLEYGYDITSSKRIHKADWRTEGIPFYRTRELVKLSEQGFVDNDLFIEDKLYNEIKELFGVPKINDILISGVGTIGIPWVVENENKFYFKDGNVIWLKSKNKILPKFIFYLFKSEFIKKSLKEMASGTTVDTYTIVNAKKTKIPLPPLETQQRIVNRIESLFSKLDEAAEKVQTVIDSHEARKQTILHKAFSGELTRKWREENGVSLDSWEEKSIVNVTKYIKAGGDKPDDFQETKDINHNIPVIANGLENEGIIGYTSNSKNYENTLTIAARGTIGFPFLRNYDYYPVVRLIVIAPDETKIIAKYLYYIFLAFPEKGTGSSIPQLTVPTLKEKIFPICPIEEQKIIVTIVNSLFSTLDSVYEESIDVLEKIKNINKTILHMAFSGKL